MLFLKFELLFILCFIKYCFNIIYIISVFSTIFRKFYLDNVYVSITIKNFCFCGSFEVYLFDFQVDNIDLLIPASFANFVIE